MTTRNVDQSNAGNYLERAEQCSTAMHRAFSDGNWNACVINAIHTGISSADAICVHKLGKRIAAQSHIQAASLLAGIRPETEELKKAVKHLVGLIGDKTDAEYGERLSTQREAENAVKHAERILSYAKSVVKA